MVFVRAFGFDVVTAAGGADNTGTTFEICTAAVATAANCKAGVAGAGLGQFPNNEPKRVTADTTGAIYTVENSANFRVQKFTPQVGPPVLDPQVFAAGVLSGTSTADAPTDVAIGASNRVFVTKAFPAGAGTPAAAVAERRVLELDSAGALQDTHMALAEVSTANGLTVDRPDGEVLVSAEYLIGSNTAHRVYRLNDVAGPLTAAIAPATDVGARGATFNGQVNPGGNLSGYHFEYSKAGSTGTYSRPVTSALAPERARSLWRRRSPGGLSRAPSTTYGSSPSARSRLRPPRLPS